jgi:hypothetical protein
MTNQKAVIANKAAIANDETTSGANPLSGRKTAQVSVVSQFENNPG